MVGYLLFTKPETLYFSKWEVFADNKLNLTLEQVYLAIVGFEKYSEVTSISAFSQDVFKSLPLQGG